MSNERQLLRQRVKELEQRDKRQRQEIQMSRERLTAIEEVLYRQSQRGLGRATPTIDEPGQSTLFGDASENAPESAPEEDAEPEPMAADETSDATSAATPPES